MSMGGDVLGAMQPEIITAVTTVTSVLGFMSVAMLDFAIIDHTRPFGFGAKRCVALVELPRTTTQAGYSNSKSQRFHTSIVAKWHFLVKKNPA